MNNFLSIFNLSEKRGTYTTTGQKLLKPALV
jgi:hypothetical protein